MNVILRTAPGLMVLVLALAFPAVAQSGYTLLSPDKRIEVRVRTAERIQYDVLLNGKVLLQDCALSLDAHPKHNVTLPFTKMFLGPMDYTPGAMLKRHPEGLHADLRPSHESGYSVPPTGDLCGV